LSVIAGFLWLLEADDLHLGLGNTQWRESPAAALIRKLPAAAPIYSNQVWYVYFVTGRTNLFGLPNVNVDAARGIANENYAKEMDAMLQSIAAHHGSIVVFTADQPTLKNSVSAAQLKNNSALRVSAQTPDAVIFTAASP